MAEPKPLASLSSGLLARKGNAKPAMRRQGLAAPKAGAVTQDDLGWNDMGYDVDPVQGEQTGIHDGEVNVDMPTPIHSSNPLAGAIPETIPAVKKQQEEIAQKFAAEEPEHKPANASKSNGSAPVSTKVDALGSPVTLSQTEAPVELANDEPEAYEPPAIPNFDLAKMTPLSAKSSAAKSKSTEAKQGLAEPVVKKRAPVKKPAKKSAKKAAFTLRVDPERHLKLRLACAVNNCSAQQLVTAAMDEFLKTVPGLEELANRIPGHEAA